MKRTFLQLVIGFFSLLALAGCSKSDDTVNYDAEFKGKAYYKITKVDYLFYSIESQQAGNATALILDIAKFMGYDLDDEGDDIIIEGKSLEECDAEAKKLFEQATGLVDPDDYDGRYTVSLSRVIGKEQLKTIAEKTLIAERDNSKRDDTDWDWEQDFAKQNQRQYIYDLAIAACPSKNYGKTHDARNLLKRYGYTYFGEMPGGSKAQGDFNYWCTEKPEYDIFIGYKCGKLTDQTDEFFSCNVVYHDENEEEKEHSVYRPYVFECIISSIVIVNGSRPKNFICPAGINDEGEGLKFEPFTIVGQYTTGNLEQGEGGELFPYFARINMAIDTDPKAINWLGYYRHHTKTTGQTFVNSVRIEKNGNATSCMTPQNLHSAGYWNIYLGYESSKVMDNVEPTKLANALEEERPAGRETNYRDWDGQDWSDDK